MHQAPRAAAHCAQARFSRMRTALQDRPAAEDLAVLDDLLSRESPKPCCTAGT